MNEEDSKTNTLKFLLLLGLGANSPDQKSQ